MSKEFVWHPPSNLNRNVNSHFGQNPLDGSKLSPEGGFSKNIKTKQKSKNVSMGELQEKIKMENSMRLSLEVSDMETRLLECEILLEQLKTCKRHTPEIIKDNTVEDRDASERNVDKTKKHNITMSNRQINLSDIKMSNVLPDRDTEKLNSKFTTQEVNLAIMNPGGMKGKADAMSNAMHTHDIRICIVSETHCVGKEIPVLNPQTKAFHNNRGSKNNKGGVCIFVENSIAEDCVVIGKSDNNKNKD